MCANQKSEFIFIAMMNVECIALGKRFLQNYLFPKYPLIAKQIIADSERRYMSNIRNILMHDRQHHISDINRQSAFKQINIIDKNEVPEFCAEVRPDRTR